MNPYSHFVSQYVRVLADGFSIPLGTAASAPHPSPPSGAPVVLIFSPHPDDECIIGALPLRLLRQSRMRVVNVAVTQGSRKDRQEERLRELQQACAFLGYDLIQTGPRGLERVNVSTRQSDPAFWSQSVAVIRGILETTRPAIIFFPHDSDWNSTHIGTHWLVMDALAQIGSRLNCLLVETEYWGQMTNPNLMVESSPDDVADMMAGTSFHAGEVRRNPFHLFLPAWMQDNVRRGSELVGGQGEAAPDFRFATLYRLRKWNQGACESVLAKGLSLPAGQNPQNLFDSH